jgi:eukaryotic-like serine/threonine-protein kinase
MESSPIYEFGPFRLDPAERLLVRAGQPVSLPPKAFDLLVHLVKKSGRLVSKHDLMSAVWPDSFVEEANLTYTVSTLRKTLGNGQVEGEQSIQTVPGRGYRFAADVRIRTDPSPPAGILATTAHDLAGSDNRQEVTSSRRTPVVSSGWSLAGTIALLVLAGGLLGASATWWGPSRRASGSPAPVVRSELGIRPAEELNGGSVSSNWMPTPGGSRTALAWTPDGRSLVFAGRQGGVQQLYVRSLEAADASPLAGTEGAQAPAVSADGQWVAFWATGALKKAPIGGGPVMELATAQSVPEAIVWVGRDLFFSQPDTGIWRLPAGGVPAPVSTPGEAERAHIPSSVLPGDRVLLYTSRKRVWTWGDEEVVALDLATGERTVLVHDAADTRYAPTGHLLFLRRSVLFAVPFVPGSLSVRGTPVPVLERIAQSLVGGNARDMTGAGQYAFTAGGTLAWIRADDAPDREATLVTVDRRGRVSALPAPGRNYAGPVRLSPDGRQLAVPVRTATEQGIWLYDLERSVLSPVHRGGEANWPGWSRDGRHVIFRWLDDGRDSLVFQGPGESAPSKVVAAGHFVPAVSLPGGEVLGVLEGDLAIAEFDGGQARIEAFRQTADVKQWPEISPDGQWLAYGAHESGQFQVYIEPYPRPGPRTLVSVDNGASPAWHPNGRELFYVSAAPGEKRRMMAADFEPGTPPRVGTPRMLFEFPLRALDLACVPLRCYDVSADGQRFYTVQQTVLPPQRVVTHVQLVQNWFEELKRLVPTN